MKRFKQLGFDVGPRPALSITIFRMVPQKGDPDQFNQQLLQYIHEEGTTFVSSTLINQVFWIRMAILNFRSHKEDVDHFINILKEGIAYITQRSSVI